MTVVNLIMTGVYYVGIVQCLWNIMLNIHDSYKPVSDEFLEHIFFYLFIYFSIGVLLILCLV